MTIFSAPLEGNRVVVDLPGVTINFVVHKERNLVVAESLRPIDFGKTLLARVRTVFWTPELSRGNGSFRVSKTGPAYASGSGAKAVTGIALHSSNYQSGEDTVKISLPGSVTHITVKSAAHFTMAEELFLTTIDDQR